jgi:tetratricopeptide (TPR) repeat protein
MLEAASVAGAEFSAATVAAACERTVLDVEACCTGLSRRAQFVRSDGVSAWPDGTITSNFCFHHALYREVLYRRVPAGHRGELHRRIAKRQEEAHAEGPAEVAAELAYHYTRCGDNAKALKYLALAGEHAMACHAYGEAEQHYRNALSVLIMLDKTSERDRRELALQMALGGVMTTTRGYSAAETTQTYMRARNLAAEIGDTELLQVLRGLRASAATRGEVRAALVLADQMLACARAIGSDSALVTAHNARGNVRHSMGDLLGARNDFSTAIAHYRAEDFRSVPNDLGVSSLIWAGLNDWSLGFPASALNKAHEALELAERQSNPFVVSAALSLGGWVHILRRDYRSALEAGAKAVSLSAASGFPVWEALGRINSAWARAHLGEIAGTLESINEALTDLDAINFYVSRAAWMGMLCETQALSGMVDDASITIGRALQINFDEMIYRPELLRLRGVLHLWRGGGAKRRIELAERDFREAINLAGSMSAKSYELRATTSLACLLNSLGRSEEASVMLAEIYNWFTEGFDTADLKDAKTLLDELGT